MFIVGFFFSFFFYIGLWFLWGLVEVMRGRGEEWERE